MTILFSKDRIHNLIKCFNEDSGIPASMKTGQNKEKHFAIYCASIWLFQELHDRQDISAITFAFGQMCCFCKEEEIVEIAVALKDKVLSGYEFNGLNLYELAKRIYQETVCQGQPFSKHLLEKVLDNQDDK